MPRRTVVYQQIPWTGGVNTSVDPGVLPSNDVVQADNVVFTTSAARIKRQGFDYFDRDIPKVTHRGSSGTTRTLVFEDTIFDQVTDQRIVIGERLSISGSDNANYNSQDAIVLDIKTTNVTNDTIEYTFSSATSFSESLIEDAGIKVERNYDIIAVHDHWYYDVNNNNKVQVLVAVTSQGFLFRYDANGQRRLIPAAQSNATPLVITPLTSAQLLTFNNKLIWCMSGYGNTPKYVDFMSGDEWLDLPGAPDFSIMREHLGRLFTNDKGNPDYLHYCETFDETKWQGIGDSGAIPISEGDGDNQGIVGIFPTFMGRLFVAKGMRLFQVVGTDPEEWIVDSMSNGIGTVSHLSAVSVDLDDVFYFSHRGVHSLKTTDRYGDFEGAYLSQAIKPTFDSWNKGQLRNVQGVYIPALNCVAWTVTEDGYTKPNAIWLFNPFVKDSPTDVGKWFRWPNVNAQSICTRNVENKFRVVIGNDKGRILIGQNGRYDDHGNGITFRVKSGTIYPDGNPQTIKAFKKFGLLYRPKGKFSFTAYFKVDSLPPQPLVFEQSQVGDILGVNFVLGQSILGNSSIMAPYMKDVVGHGRGFTIEIFQTGSEAQIEIYGFLVEYELADIADEVIQDARSSSEE